MAVYIHGSPEPGKEVGALPCRGRVHPVCRGDADGRTVPLVVASIFLFNRLPQSFLPEEDQGAIFAAMRLPEGASINRTEEIVKQVEDLVRPIPGVQGILSVVGLNFIDYIASSNQAFFVVRLKPYEERTDPAQSASAIITRPRSRTYFLTSQRSGFRSKIG